MREQISTYLSADQMYALNEVSEKAGVSKSMMIRRGIDMAIAEMEERLEAIEIGMKVIDKRRNRRVKKNG